jgi:hypothetical protein
MEEYNLAKVRVEGSIPSGFHPSSGRYLAASS